MSAGYQPPPRRRLTKEERHQVLEMCDHRCAYCGTELETTRQLHVDHVIPMEFHELYSVEGYDLDTMDNYLPACCSCNIYKHTYRLEKFRAAIERMPDVLFRDAATFRHAVRFGMVEVKPHPVVFYFEQIGVDVPALHWDDAINEKYAKEREPHEGI